MLPARCGAWRGWTARGNVDEIGKGAVAGGEAGTAGAGVAGNATGDGDKAVGDGVA